MKGMKRVCIFCELWKTGGIESFLCNILSKMDLEHVQVDIVAAELSRSIFTEPLEKRGVQFFELSGSPRSLLENRRRFLQLQKERKWEVIYLNAFQALALYYLRLAKKAGIPVRIAHSHNTALRRSPTRFLKQCVHEWAKARFTQDATTLWACSKGAAEFLFSRRELERKGFRFIPNCVDTRRFRFDRAAREAVRKQLDLTDTFVIGNVGRLCYQKNQGFLLEVLAEVLKASPDSRLLLVGEGEDKLSLAEKAKQLGVENAVIFYGPTNQMEQLLWAMDIFALPSRFEGLPVSAVEAQAAGLSCIFSSAISEECMISPGTVSFLRIKNNAKEWAVKIIALQEDAAERSETVIQSDIFDIKNVSRFIQEKFENGVE